MRGCSSCVADATAAREQLVGRGVECSEIRAFDERDGGTFFGFADPDGNTWAVQQLKVRGAPRLIRTSRGVVSAPDGRLPAGRVNRQGPRSHGVR